MVQSTIHISINSTSSKSSLLFTFDPSNPEYISNYSTMNISHLTYDKIIQNTFIDSLKNSKSHFTFQKIIYLSHTRPLFISHAIKCRPSTLPSPPSSQRGLFHRDEIKLYRGVFCSPQLSIVYGGGGKRPRIVLSAS